MLSKIKKGLHRRKVKIFLMFLLCSSFAWFLSKLSEPYTSNTIFDIEYHNTPDSLLLSSVSKKSINVRLKASGFKFLGFNFSRKKIVIDLSSLEKRRSSFYVSQRVYKNQIENQLPGSMELSGIDNDTIFFKFQEVISKRVPIVSKIEIVLAQNYLLESLSIKPDSVLISGPRNEIETIKFIETEQKLFAEQTTNISEAVSLKKNIKLENTTLSENKVNVQGTVYRFSEKKIEVAIEVVNLPKGFKIKTFPNKVPVLCRAKIEALKKLKSSDIKLVADYNMINEESTSVLVLKLKAKPENIYSADLMETEVEYILKRQ